MSSFKKTKHELRFIWYLFDWLVRIRIYIFCFLIKIYIRSGTSKKFVTKFSTSLYNGHCHDDDDDDDDDYGDDVDDDGEKVVFRLV